MDECTHQQAEGNGLSGAPDSWPLSARDAARIAGVSERTIRRAIARGELSATKHAGVYRIDPKDLERYRLRTANSGSARSLPSHGRMPPPRLPSPLIGRMRECATVRDMLLREGVRLVTLTGPGGVGKTYIALQLAADITDVFNDGASFVDLSPVRDPRLVLPAISQAIGFRDYGRHARDDALVAFLRPRELLLVLDNCEQVIEAAPRIAGLLAACPNLHILATSRIPLRLRGEHRFPVDPLPVPASVDDRAELLAQSGAFQLFVERALAVDPALATTDDDLRAIAAICRRLDGLPLAIELAAVWSPLLPPPDLLAQLSDRMRRPGSGPRDLPHRQRTVPDTIAWSYDLLAPEDQDLFRRLAVFVDGFDLEAAIAIADAPPADVLDRLGALVEQSLLRRTERSGTGERFVFLETVRDYAWEQLDEHGETKDVRGRHAEYFLGVTEDIALLIYGPTMRQCLDRLEDEHSNCLAALRQFVETGDVSRERRLAAMLSEYWLYRGQLSEGIATLRAAVERGGAGPPGPRAKAMLELAALHLVAGSTNQAASLSATAVSVARESGDPEWLGQALWVRANAIGSEDGRAAEAIAMLEEGLQLARDRHIPDTSLQSALAAIGTLRLRLGEREHGAALLQDALGVLRALGCHLEAGTTAQRIGRLDHQDGKLTVAAARYGEALRAYGEAGVVTQAGFVLADLARTVATSGYPISAARIAGMAQAIAERSGATGDGNSPFVLMPIPTETLTTTDYGYQEAVTAGWNLPFNDALTEAIAIADALAEGKAPPGAAGEKPARPPGPLSSRERDVLALLAQRYTAPEIADQLFISVRTVERHVSNVYDKLGVRSRRAAVAAAAHHGLV